MVVSKDVRFHETETLNTLNSGSEISNDITNVREKIMLDEHHNSEAKDSSSHEPFGMVLEDDVWTGRATSDEEGQVSVPQHTETLYYYPILILSTR